MDPDSPLHLAAAPTLTRFLERVGRSFAHDLRTPLGAIVNYAAVLEADQGTNAEEVRDLARRIRGNAQRAARMVDLLATATGHASRPLRASTTDLGTLAASLLHDAGGRGQVRAAPPGAKLVAEVDAEVLGFAWRAWVAVESDARGRPLDEAEVRLVATPELVTIELASGGSGAAGAVEDLSSYLCHNGGPARLETSMGLGLAEDLIVSHGGDFGVWGRPGSASGLCVRFSVEA